MISQLEVYKSCSLHPYENIATEKFLLDTVPKNTLRLYLWQNENTVVIGRNQNPWAECNCATLEADGGFVARRLSGGGAVFHDVGNLNFTFLCHEEDYNLKSHLAVIQKACEYVGVSAEISGRNDILANGKKFSGNAFYQSKGKAYHHGTLLISSNTEKLRRYLTPKQEKLKAKGVKSVESRVVNLCEINPEITPTLMAQNMIKALESTYNLTAELLPKIESQQLKSDIDFFSGWDFIYGKTPAFSVSFEKRFEWGDFEINLSLSGGKIAHVKVFTDSLDYSLSKTVEDALQGVKFNLSAIKAALSPLDIPNDIFALLEEKLADENRPESP